MIHLRGRYVVETTNAEAGTGRRSPTRGPCESWSEKSARRLRDYLDSALAVYRVFVTLTYPGWSAGALDYTRAKRDLAAWSRRYRREYGGAGSSLVWVMEHTSQDYIHFHLLSNHWLDRMWVARTWYEVCSTEDRRHLLAGTRVEALRDAGAGARYIAKYLTKDMLAGARARVKGSPGRWWGVIGSRDCVEATIRVQGRGEKAQEAAGTVKKALYRVLGDWIQAGKAREVDLSRCPDVPSGARMWCIPSIKLRQALARMMVEWKFGVEVAVNDRTGLWGDGDDDPAGFGDLCH